MRLTALFDMDGSLADFEGQLYTDLMKLAAPGEDMPRTNFWAAERIPHIRARMMMIRSQPGWWLNLPEIPKGFVVLEMAREMDFHIEVVTKGPRKNPLAWTEKLEWCMARGLRDVHVVSDKTRFGGHLLYDDYQPYLEGWLEHHPTGLGIQPVDELHPPFKHPRVVNWTGENLDEVREAMAKLKHWEKYLEAALPGKQ